MLSSSQIRHSVSSLVPTHYRRTPPGRLPVTAVLPVFILLVALALSGCHRLHSDAHEYVYVAARQVYLHDRVAAVSNRVALVTNGQRLLVVERGKRFYKVTTDQNQTGWVEEHAVIDQDLYKRFQDLAEKHAQDVVTARAQLRDELFVHVLPGREQDHFYLIPENTKVELLQRGTVEKVTPGQPALKPKAPPAPSPAPGPAAPNPAAAGKTAPAVSPSATVVAPEPPPMEDWWLVRDPQGHVGWLLAGRLDVEIPDEVGGYAEGQRIVAAFPIATVIDNGEKPKKPEDRAGKHGKAKAAPEPAAPEAPTAPIDPRHTEYVTLLTPLHNGLPYDFDQVRVFTWSLNHHRYETGFRLRGVQGYLPLRISEETVNGQKEPVFSFQIANGPNVSIDPDTGTAHPLNPRTISFRLEGNMIKRTGADQGPIQLTHAAETANKPSPKSKKKKH